MKPTEEMPFPKLMTPNALDGYFWGKGATAYKGTETFDLTCRLPAKVTREGIEEILCDIALATRFHSISVDSDSLGMWIGRRLPYHNQEAVVKIKKEGEVDCRFIFRFAPHPVLGYFHNIFTETVQRITEDREAFTLSTILRVNKNELEGKLDEVRYLGKDEERRNAKAVEDIIRRELAPVEQRSVGTPNFVRDHIKKRLKS